MLRTDKSDLLGGVVEALLACLINYSSLLLISQNERVLQKTQTSSSKGSRNSAIIFMEFDTKPEGDNDYFAVLSTIDTPQIPDKLLTSF